MAPEPENGKDAYAACMADIGDPHMMHPLRRIVIGPLPASMVSSRTLIEAARETHAPVDDILAEDPSTSDVQSPFPRLFRQRSMSTLPRTPTLARTKDLRHSASTSSLAEGAFNLQPRIMTQAMEPLAEEPLSYTDDVSELPPNIRSVPPRSQRQSRRTQSGASLQDTFSASSDALPKDYGLGKHRRRFPTGWKHYARRHDSRETQASSPYGHSIRNTSQTYYHDRNFSQYSMRSAPPPMYLFRDEQFQWLSSRAQRDLEYYTAVPAMHHRMLGSSFEVGAKFYEELDKTFLQPQKAAREQRLVWPHRRANSGAQGPNSAPMQHTQNDAHLDTSMPRASTIPTSAPLSAPQPGAPKEPPEDQEVASVQRARTVAVAKPENAGDLNDKWSDAQRQVQRGKSLVGKPGKRSVVMERLEQEIADIKSQAAPTRFNLPNPDAAPNQDTADVHDACSRNSAPRKSNACSETASHACTSSADRSRSSNSAHTRSEASDKSSLDSIPATPTVVIPTKATKSSKSIFLDNKSVRPGERLDKSTRLMLEKKGKRKVTFAKSSFAPSLLSATAEDLTSNLVAHGEPIPVGPGNCAPASADEVLSRPSDPPIPVEHVKWDLLKRAKELSEPISSVASPVLKRDRMLVKVQYASNMDPSVTFNQFEARKYEIRSFAWLEFIVVLRLGKLELWSEPMVRGRLLGHTNKLKLRHSIVLERGVTYFSVYSVVDRLFCLTLPRRINPDTKQSRKSRIPFRRSGTLILILNARTMSSAADWTWILYRQLGGTIPKHLIVHIPDISVRIRVPVPELDTQEPLKGDHEYHGALDTQGYEEEEQWTRYGQMTQVEMIRAVGRLVKVMPNWAWLSERLRSEGLKTNLAWRAGSVYDWVTYDTTAQGFPRFWSVMSGGLLLASRRVPVLELAENLHYPSNTLHPNGTKLQEPPALEGFLWRIRPVSNTSTIIYFTSQKNLLFMTRESRSFAPDNYFGLPLDPKFDVPSMDYQERLRAFADDFAKRDHVRQQLQIRYSEGLIDLRDVCAIQSTGTGVSINTSLSPTTVSLGAQLDTPLHAYFNIPNLYTLFDYDGRRDKIISLLNFPTGVEAGGEGDLGLQDAPDKSKARAYRQFDLLLSNGRRISLEAISADMAQEWIVRLIEMTIYWACRMKMDKWVLMNESGNNPNYFVVCAGTIVPFKLMSSVRSATSRQNEGILYKRVDPLILLRDAYIYTGTTGDSSKDINAGLGSSRRVRTMSSVGEPQIPRLFKDGLGSIDKDDDCTFVLRVRMGHDSLSAHQNVYRLARGKSVDADAEFIPSLSDHGYGQLIFRAKTTIERDLWVRAIALEIESLARSEIDRDVTIRKRGNIY
ncbi:hypothetical protein MVES_002768 [Malassezia vespertilionis]|uniref:Uncharacterized protein n=1 Tax=Malassezia vespertilionis TaxID=2020962 RepID=A0A2N1J932_9BASI|nr:hypothetical protein MVES_002768 [Malassezia vespertilionis]